METEVHFMGRANNRRGETRFYMDELYRDLFRDYLITVDALHWRIGHDYYQPERWST